MFSKRWMVLILPAALLIVLAFTIQGAIATANVTRPIPNTGAVLDRAHSAEAARLSGQAREVERALRVHKADTARWNALAEYYRKMPALADPRSQRALDAETARWEALKKYYKGMQSQEVTQP